MTGPARELAILLVGSCALVLVGCTSQPDPPQPTSASSPAAAPSPSAPSSPAPTPCSPEQISRDAGLGADGLRVSYCDGRWALVEYADDPGGTLTILRLRTARWQRVADVPTTDVCQEDLSDEGAPRRVWELLEPCEVVG